MKNVVLTGSTGGLGQSILQKCLKEKYNVLSISKSDPIKLIEIKDKFSKKGLEFNHIKIDFSKPVNSYEKQLSKFHNYTNLVLCHAVLCQGDFEKFTVEDIQSSMQVNFISSYLLCQFFLKNWKNTNDKKTITYVSSVATKMAAPSELPYHSSKKAMESTIISIAREYSSKNIHANIVSPGLMNTKMGRMVIETRPDVVSRIPLGKLVSTEEVSALIFSLITTNNITGQNFHINGGRYFSAA